MAIVIEFNLKTKTKNLIHMRTMKKFLYLAFILALPLLMVSCGDDDNMDGGDDNAPGSIAELASASDDLNTLVAALSQAGLVETFSDPTADFTVFAPTDDAFAAAGIDLNTIDNTTLTAVLQYHVLTSSVLSTELSNGDVTTLNGAAVTVDLTDGVKINDATVTQADIEASNGVIHIIDKVLLPPTEDNSIAGLAQATEDLSILVDALIKAELVETLSGSDDFTVFAPTNQAFIDAGIDLDAVSVEDLTNILLYHVLADPVTSDQLSNSFVETLNETYVEVNIDGGVSINDASVATPDIAADNGVIHIIDKVLLPPSGNIVDIAIDASTASAPEFTALVGAITKVTEDPDLADLVSVLSDEDGDFTVFAPTDAAFNNLLDFLGASSLDDVDAALLQDVLLYHVVAGDRVFSTDLESGELETALADQLLVLDAGELSLADAGTLADANIQTAAVNIQGTNGVIHAIDKVLLPARSIMDLVNFNAEFSTLKAALETAELTETLADLEKEYTVFAPTNDAFADYLDLANISAADLLASPALSDILLYHVVTGSVFSDELANGFVTTVNGQAVEIDLSSGVAVRDVSAATTDASVAIADLAAGNGVVHIIDQVLIPETDDNIVDVASGNDDLSTLVSLLSNYPDLVEALTDEAGNFTVFAPTNAAFEEISDITATLTSDQIKEVLQYHVIDSRVYSSDLSDGQSPEMLNGETITINIDGSVTITDKSEASEDATVTATDVQTITGVVHIIDKVIIPEL